MLIAIYAFYILYQLLCSTSGYMQTVLAHTHLCVTSVDINSPNLFNGWIIHNIFHLFTHVIAVARVKPSPAMNIRYDGVVRIVLIKRTLERYGNRCRPLSLSLPAAATVITIGNATKTGRCTWWGFILFYYYKICERFPRTVRNNECAVREDLNSVEFHS